MGHIIIRTVMNDTIKRNARKILVLGKATSSPSTPKLGSKLASRHRKKDDDSDIPMKKIPYIDATPGYIPSNAVTPANM